MTGRREPASHHAGNTSSPSRTGTLPELFVPMSPRAGVQEAAGSQSSADQLAKLADLRDRGVITAAEFDREKAKILA